MRYGYIICGLAHDAAHVVLAATEPPPPIKTTDWSQFPAMPQPNLLIEGTGTYFLLRIPGNAKGLWTALEAMMDVAGVHRDGYAGLENHRLLLTAVGKVRIGATDRVVLDFTLSPERHHWRKWSASRNWRPITGLVICAVLRTPGAPKCFGAAGDGVSSEHRLV